MYKKGVAAEIQFSSARLQGQNPQAYRLGLAEHEARALYEGLKVRLAAASTAAPWVVSLDESVAPVAPVADKVQPAVEFKHWVCVICGWIYDEEAGLPEEGIAPGTRFADIDEDWRCPLCDVGKEDFVVVEF